VTVNPSEIANNLINQGKSPAEIVQLLTVEGVSLCVAREWANEPARREALQRRRDTKRKNKRHIGHPRSFNRRVLYTTNVCGRERYYHATKGWRDRRDPEYQQAA